MIRKLKLILFGVFLLLMSWFSLWLYALLTPPNLSKINNQSRVVTDRDGNWLYAQITSDEKWRFELNSSKLDPFYLRTLILFEDKNFYSHHGVDILALLRAVTQLIKNQKIVSGGSTITMQLARLLDPKPRTVLSKLQEIFKAYQIEMHFSKNEILEAYLSLTPYGGNVEGVVGASMRYFGKLPYSLTAAQAALLIALPQSPEKFRPDKHLKNAIYGKNKVLARAYESHFIDSTQYKLALLEKLPTEPLNYPRLAPHLASKLLADTTMKTKKVETTLDASLQQQLELWSGQKSYQLPKETTLALLVVRNSDASILAYIGSHDRFSKRVSGYIDMIDAIRSPGSTLKPFIYGIGFDKYYIHPNTIILDQETHFGDYMPHNFDNTYNGEVTIAYALQHSLNIPAVKVLQRIGIEDFLGKIKNFTPSIHIPKQQATLPIALGGLGLSLRDLTNLYTALASGGTSKAIHYLQTEQKIQTLTLMQFKSAHMLTSILRNIEPPLGFINKNNTIAYKTGTSYGYRDNWAIGYTPEYTVALWVGKPNNATQAKLTGRIVAAPFLFEIFALLDTHKPLKSWQSEFDTIGDLTPKGLEYFEPKLAHTKNKELSMLYPKNNSRFRNANCSDTFVEFKIEQGTPPYSWYIDNKPLDNNKTTATLPFGIGAHIITIIDAAGKRITTNIWIDTPEC